MLGSVSETKPTPVQTSQLEKILEQSKENCLQNPMELGIVDSGDIIKQAQTGTEPKSSKKSKHLKKSQWLDYRKRAGFKNKGRASKRSTGKNTQTK